MKENKNNLMDKIVSLCKRRGFVFPGSEIYGGLENSWDFGHLGIEIKNNIKNFWWQTFVHNKEDVVGIDSTVIMNTEVWKSSGHIKEFSDPLIECKKCHQRFREDEIEDVCPGCGNKEFTENKQFNLMFETNLGPLKGNSIYLRPETAQGMFVGFKNILDTNRLKIPFGIAQIGKAFRNEITSGNFIFRLREFEMMEIEYFIKENEWEKQFNYWHDEILDWMKNIGIKNIHSNNIKKEELAHYSKKTVDFEYDFPFGRKELCAVAYRGNYDLRSHFKKPPYKDQETQEEYWPHVIEPTWGLERLILAVLCENYHEDKDRIILKLKPRIAPYKVAVFPLLSNKKELMDLARKIFNDLKKDFVVAWDARGNIGKRYYSQDEIGTPACITVDFDSLKNNDVTIRDRDTAKQERVKIQDLKEKINQRLNQ